MWSAPSTDQSPRPLVALAVAAAVVLIAGTEVASAGRSWSSLERLSGGSSFSRYDATPPSAPTGLALTSATATTLSLTWQRSHDNLRMRGYALYRDGYFIAGTSRTSMTFQGLACGRTYRLDVAAFDAAGNHSGRAGVSAGTSPCPDILAPTQPANITQTGATRTTISLFWSPSLDDVGVAGYGLYRDGGRIGTATGTSFVVAGLACGRSHLLGVDSFDAAGNRSAVKSVFASTSACPVAATQPPTSPPPTPPPTFPPPTPPPPAVAPQPPATTGLNRIGTYDMDFLSHPEAYGLLLTNAWHLDRAKAFRGSRPLKLLFYVQPWITRWGTSGIMLDRYAGQDGLVYNWVSQNRPDWFLRRSDGSEITFYGGVNVVVNLANPDYQRLWIDSVVKVLERGWNGIVIDDVISFSIAQEYGWLPPGYDEARWNGMISSFVQAVAAGVRAKGYSVVPNIGSRGFELGTSNINTTISWGKALGNYHSEHWLRWADSPVWFPQSGWEWKRQQLQAVESAGVPFSTTLAGGLATVAEKRYAYYSYLLFHDPALGGSFTHDVSGADVYDSVYEDLGRPLGAATQSGSVWTRRFERGTIEVNSATRAALKR